MPSVRPDVWPDVGGAGQTGRASRIVLRGPDGERSDGTAVFLDAVPQRRLAFTNAYAPGWIPAARPSVVPFMTTVVELSDAQGGTRQVVRALHWTEEARDRHEQMGFHGGWAAAAERLQRLARTLPAGSWEDTGPRAEDIAGTGP